MRKKESTINWLQVVTVFILGILIASNIFMFWNFTQTQEKAQQDINLLSQEINKLKSDDVALAQAINNLTTQLQAIGIIKTGASED
jgi:cell division protein FtsB